MSQNNIEEGQKKAAEEKRERDKAAEKAQLLSGLAMQPVSKTSSDNCESSAQGRGSPHATTLSHELKQMDGHQTGPHFAGSLNHTMLPSSYVSVIFPVTNLIHLSNQI